MNKSATNIEQCKKCGIHVIHHKSHSSVKYRASPADNYESRLSSLSRHMKIFDMLYENSDDLTPPSALWRKPKPLYVEKRHENK